MRGEPRVDPRIWLCESKIGYDTRYLAMQRLQQMLRQRQLHRGLFKIEGWKSKRSRMKPYRCRFCGRWHLGHE